MRLCVTCGMPIAPHRQKTCGELCAREWSRAYHRQYHQDHLEQRRAVHRDANRIYYASPEGREARRRYRNSEKGKAKARERATRYRARPEHKAAKSKRQAQQRANWTAEQHERHLEIKRKSWLRHREKNLAKSAYRKKRDPAKVAEYTRKRARRATIAYQVLQQLGISIDLDTLEVNYAHDNS